MQPKNQFLNSLAALSAVLLIGAGCNAASTTIETDATASYEEQLKAASAAREKDPAWKPAHQQIATIQVGQSKKGGKLNNFCVNVDGNILACCGNPGTGTAAGNEIRVYSPDGKLLWRAPRKGSVAESVEKELASPEPAGKSDDKDKKEQNPNR